MGQPWSCRSRRRRYLASERFIKYQWSPSQSHLGSNSSFLFSHQLFRADVCCRTVNRKQKRRQAFFRIALCTGEPHSQITLISFWETLCWPIRLVMIHVQMFFWLPDRSIIGMHWLPVEEHEAGDDNGELWWRSISIHSKELFTTIQTVS